MADASPSTPSPPGPVATRLFLEGKPKEAIEGAAKASPLGRLGEPDDIARVVSFLVGPDGGWINGQILRANGGGVWTLPPLLIADRTQPQQKAETQARADRGAYPTNGVKPADVREALSHIDSLDRDR